MKDMNWLKARYRNQMRIHWYWMKCGTNGHTFVDYLQYIAKNNGFKSEDFNLNVEKSVKHWSLLKLKEHAEISDVIDNIVDKSTFDERI